MKFDFHTHRLSTPPGTGIVNLPEAWVARPELFRPEEGAFYSAGIHPWWTAGSDRCEAMLRQLPLLLRHPQVVRVGECGLDRLRGASLPVQAEVFAAQVALAEELGLPLTLHVVRAFDLLLQLRKRLRPTTPWVVHGFRGGPALARQLLEAGIDLSFGPRRNPQAYSLTPPQRRYEETDGEG